MANEKMKTYVKQLIHIHLPIYFMDHDHLEIILDDLCKDPPMSRRETLILAYCVGASEQETNILLKINGHASLYVKNYEDAVWHYFLKSNTDVTEIIDKIFD